MLTILRVWLVSLKFLLTFDWFRFIGWIWIPWIAWLLDFMSFNMFIFTPFQWFSALLAFIWFSYLQVYYVYGFMLLVFVILIIVTICVTIVGTYFLLNAENYHWQWTSFFSAASTALYVYFYSIYYYHVKTKMSGFFQTSFYFGYTLMFCLGLGILCGKFARLSPRLNDPELENEQK